MKVFDKLFLLVLLFAIGCGQPTSQSETNTEEDAEENPNQALYDQVMNVHDEVMPKMEDIYKLKSQLQEMVANTPDMVMEKKESVENTILQLDSASNLMMDWMHQFDPLPDSSDAEEARAYLESQMEKIKKVKEEMEAAIEQAKGQASN
ncbi:MAG: hypothetical protein R2820_15225 [Cyclobacteriaceae bacterium]|nr:hypothetical protein [Cyclobacteriaceae bacterium]